MNEAEQKQFIKDVEDIRKKNLDTYKLDSNRFNSDIQMEGEIRKMYKGRQLLELLQNADDAHAEKVKIILDKANRTIKICNTGNPFSAAGFGALMLAYNGTKTAGKKNFIGNKGLGFRSILNWANQVDVKSNGCWVHFSRRTAYEIAQEMLSDSWSAIKRVIDSLGRVNNEIAPILSLPNIGPCEPQVDGWDTEITICYNADADTERDVDEQLEFITSKALLFVHHIKSLEIVGTNNDRLFESSLESSVQTGKEFDRLQVVETKDGKSVTHDYRIFRTEGIVPREIQEREQGAELTVDSLYYEVCVAIDGEIKEKEYLYSYFRTNIMLELPCIVHAAFVLDPSRNYLISDSVVNEFLIQEVLKQFEMVAEFLCDTQAKSWRAYQLLNMKKKPDEVHEYLCQLYEGLKIRRCTCEVYPCVDGVYRNEFDVRYYDDAFSKFVEENYSDKFPDMLIPICGNCNEEIAVYGEDEIWEKLDEICARNLNVVERVELLKALSDPIVVGKIPNPEKPSPESPDTKNLTHLLQILVDRENKPIKPQKTIYTTPSRELKTPGFAQISFVSKEMYEELKKSFPCAEDPDSETDSVARHICDCIAHYVKLKAYDAAALTPDIIRFEKKAVKKFKDTNLNFAQDCVVQTVQALLHNYLVSNEARVGSEKKYEGLLLLARDRSIVEATSLYLSKTYTEGALTESIYGDVVSSKEYLADRSVWKIEAMDVSEGKLDSFFSLCGVTKFVKYEENYLTDAVDFAYIREYLLPACDAYRGHGKTPNNLVCKLVDVQKLNRLDLTKLLILLSKETNVYSEIIKGTTLSFYQKSATGQYQCSLKNSLIAYQLGNRFSGVVLKKDDSEMNFLLNPHGKIDYSLLKTYDVETAAEEILVRLGAKKSFQEFTSDALYAMIRSVYENKDRYEGGRRVSKIYGDIYDVLKTHVSHDHGELNLACRLGGTVCFKKNSEVYYYDDAKLPKTILDQYPILLLRQRAGVKQVMDIFGVKRLDDTSLTIRDDLMVKDDARSRKFNEYYYARIPFIVMQRIRNLNGSLDSQEGAAKDANIIFHLVKSGKYIFDGQERELDEFEYLVYGRYAYIRIPDYSIEMLVKDKKFLETFSEILGIAFALESSELKKVFKTILRDDVPTLEADADGDRDEYERAMELLNRSASRQVMFWNRILAKKAVSAYNSSWRKTVEAYVRESLGYAFPDYYEKVDFALFDDENSLMFVKDVHAKLNVELKDFLPEFGLNRYHTEKMKNYVSSFHDVFIGQLWNLLKDRDESEKKTYCKRCTEYERCASQIITDSLNFAFVEDYETLFKDYVKSTFEVDLDLGVCEDFKSILYAKYLEGNDTSLVIEDRSLLYFEGYDEKFAGNQELDEIDGETGEESPIIPESGIVGVVGTLTPVIKVHEEDEQEHSRGPWVASEKEARQKKKAGKRAQDTVLQWLKDKYGEKCRRLRSSESNDPGKNDAAHYDILYCEGNPDNRATPWRYLEVKNASSGTFTISEAEVKFGCKLENQKKYDLALVDGSRVQFVKAFFKDKTVESFISEFNPHIHRDFLVPFKFEEET